MAAVISVTQQTPLPNGSKMIQGTITIGTYATSGVGLNLANYFKSSTTASIDVAPSDGYVFEHDIGTVAAGKVLAYNSGTATDVLDEANNSGDMSAVNAIFKAVGQPY